MKAKILRELARELGRRGGIARAKALSPTARRRSAKTAAAARWAKRTRREAR